MNRCLCFILMNSCLLLSGMRVVQAHRMEIETDGSNMSTLLFKAEFISQTESSVSTVLSPTEHKLHTSTGVLPTPAGHRFHAGSFIGGMMLALVITLAVILGYRLTCSRREVRYRAIEEHDAII